LKAVVHTRVTYPPQKEEYFNEVHVKKSFMAGKVASLLFLLTIMKIIYLKKDIIKKIKRATELKNNTSVQALRKIKWKNMF